MRQNPGAMRAILISVNGLPVSHIGCYGNEWFPTHALDQLAAEGVVFDNHFADCIGPAAAWQVWETGRFAFPGVPIDNTATCIWSKTSKTDTSLFLVQPADAPLAASSKWQVLPADTPRELDYAKMGLDALVTAGTGFLRIETDICHFLEPAADTAAGLAGAVERFDIWLNDVIQELAIRELLGEIVLCVTAGCGQVIEPQPGPTLCEQTIHLPLIFRLPGCKEAGRRVRPLTQPVDLPTTFGELLSIPVIAGHGHSLVPFLHGGAADVRTFAVATDAMDLALRSREWALYLSRPAQGDGDAVRRLYAKPEDAWEVNNLAQQHLDFAERLQRTLLTFVEASRAPGELVAPRLPTLDSE
jgi:hypothetical protein